MPSRVIVNYWIRSTIKIMILRNRIARSTIIGIPLRKPTHPRTVIPRPQIVILRLLVKLLPCVKETILTCSLVIYQLSIRRIAVGICELFRLVYKSSRTSERIGQEEATAVRDQVVSVGVLRCRTLGRFADDLRVLGIGVDQVTGRDAVDALGDTVVVGVIGVFDCIRRCRNLDESVLIIVSVSLILFLDQVAVVVVKRGDKFGSFS